MAASKPTAHLSLKTRQEASTSSRYLIYTLTSVLCMPFSRHRCRGHVISGLLLTVKTLTQRGFHDRSSLCAVFLHGLEPYLPLFEVCPSIRPYKTTRCLSRTHLVDFRRVVPKIRSVTSSVGRCYGAKAACASSSLGVT